ncbi:MAG TPA: dihydrolipoamide acetyltransferase family protein [Tepidisphaeraceae bacterium]|nr:dihydrolipoamide acetyltransferase family protein [Tepidisphaeraceae bacterium]
MPSQITMPQLSDTMTEGTVVKWHKKEGDKVRAGEELADVETDKATMPMEAYESGVLAHIAVPEGQKIKVGGVLGLIATAGENPADVKKQAASGATTSQPAKAAAPVPAPARQPEPVAAATATPPREERRSIPSVPMHPAAERRSAHARDAETDHPKQEPERVQARKDQVSMGTHGHESLISSAVADRPGEKGNGHGRARISPLARRIAEDKGIDPSQVRGSGPGGRIVQRDVVAFIEQGGSQRTAQIPATAPTIAAGEKKVIPMTKLRSAIATALQRSKQTVPHFYETIDIDVEEVSRLRERLNQKLEAEKIRLSIADFITKGVAFALVRHPALNARFNAEKGEITQYGDVNLGIAVAIPDGLIVPVLRGVNHMGLREIRAATADLVDRARAQRLRREEQSEATFSITSLGTYGVREFNAIINPPEVAILAIGAAEKRPVVRENEIVPRTVLTASLSADHRVVDGAIAAEFLRTLKQVLEEPGMLLV